MDIRERIRQQFSPTSKTPKKSKIREATKWNFDSQPNLYELDNFLRKSGYRLVDVLNHDQSSEVQGVELIIEAIKFSYLHPEISHDYKEGNFYAKVVEHGMLVASDIEEIIKGYNTALGVLNHLESLDLSKLEVVVDEEENEDEE